jgi:hypothetical protein
MAIDNLTEDQFIGIVNAHLRPSGPVESPELLFGREAAIQQIEEAYHSPGRHIFVYGDRGVGKTSVALTAAYHLNPADSTPVIVAGGTTGTFLAIVRAILAEMHGPSGRGRETVTEKKGIGLKGIGYEVTRERSTGGVPDVFDLNSCVAALRDASGSESRRRVVVIDEFDLLTGDEDKFAFAELIKQVSDRMLPLCFVFVGIGRSLDELLGAHRSTYRYLEGVQLERLNFTGRWDIIDGCAVALGMRVNADSRLRIAQISDGFPHYVHLVCTKMFWHVFREEDVIVDATPEHYVQGVRNAVTSIEVELKQAYELATRKNKDDYQEVLWAVADHFELARNTDSIYESYLRIMRVRDKTPLERKKVSQKLNALKSKACGQILMSPRRNWFEFRESMVRGYVRLRAEDNGVRLALDHEPQREPRRATANPPAAIPRSQR